MFFLLFLLIGTVLFSCVSKKKITFEPLLAQSRQHFEAGEFQKSIDSYIAAWEKYPDEKTILEAYVLTLEEMKKQADTALEKKNFASAHKIYSVLLKNYPQFKPMKNSLSFSPQFLSQRIKDCRLSLSKRQAQQSLQAGDFQKALDIYKAADEEYNNDPSLFAESRKAIEDIKRRADEAAAKEDLSAAGKAYSVLGKNYSFYEKLASSPSFSKDSLDEGVKKCRTQLTQKGLEQYRKGNLAEAISLWQGLLLFDPDNIEIKKAVDTAAQQLKKLKKK